MRAARMEPLVDYPGAGIPWRCRCEKCGNEVSPRLAGIRNGRSGCRYCGIESAAEKRREDPEVAVADMRAAGLEPLVDYPGVDTPWRCRCEKCGNEVSPMLGSIRRGQGGCRFCGGNAPVDPAVAAAEMRAAGLEPLADYPGTGTPWRCRCEKCGNEVSPMLSSIRNGSGCKICAPNAPVDPAAAAAEMRAAGLEPLEDYPGARSPWRCRCEKCGNEVSPILSNIRRGRGGCKICAPNAPVDPAVAVAEMRAAGLEPLEDYPGTGIPWRCRCEKCGNEVSPVLSSIRNGSGCRYCAEWGIDWNAPALVYLIHHEKLGSHKVGITGVESRNDRLKDFGALGWETYKTLQFSNANDAHEVEQMVLEPYREQNLCPYLSADEMKPKGGHTETVDAEAVSILELWNQIESAAESVSRISQQEFVSGDD